MINPNAKNYFTNKMCIKLEKAQTMKGRYEIENTQKTYNEG